MVHDLRAKSNFVNWNDAGQSEGRGQLKENSVFLSVSFGLHGLAKLSTLKQNAAASTPSTSSIIWSYHHSHIPNKKSVGNFGKNGLE